jgi:glycolate oxidase FAD binding subunit
VFHPLPPAMLKLQRAIKSSFDPAGIFNVGRIYPGL